VFFTGSIQIEIKAQRPIITEWNVACKGLVPELKRKYKCMQKKWIVGIDVSKKTIDVALSLNTGDTKFFEKQFLNNLKGFEQFSNWLKKQEGTIEALLFCLENTGLYHRLLVGWLQQQSGFVWVEMPVQIKWSMGLQRGKTDRLDATRICKYAYRNQDQAENYTAMDKAVQQIADLMAARSRLLQCLKPLRLPIKELSDTGLSEAAKLVETACAKSIKALEQELEQIEQKLGQVIEQDPQLKETYLYIKSVRCIGLVAALQLLIYTNGFKRFDTAKQLASYCGVAPFEYSSGTSVKGRTKVSPMANKTLKAVLHMCAVSAVRNNKEMSAFYQKKVGEGKNKMSALNAVRNKLLHRVFACVRDKRMYTEDYKTTAQAA
jgi:transposase